jgi:6-methylsalicylic acid synthase
MSGRGISEPETSWMKHTAATFGFDSADDVAFDVSDNLDLPKIRERIGTKLMPTFSIDYLREVRVSEMGFPSTVKVHMGNEEEMLVTVDVNPSREDGSPLPWSESSWAPVSDATTSIGSTLFKTPRLRMPAHIDKVTIQKGVTPPKVVHIHVKAASFDANNLAVDITIADDQGQAIAIFSFTRFSEMTVSGSAARNVDTMVHQVAWDAIVPSTAPPSFSEIVFIIDEDDALVEGYQRYLSQYHAKIATKKVNMKALKKNEIELSVSEKGIVIYLPGSGDALADIFDGSKKFTENLLSIVKLVANEKFKTRVFAITRGALAGKTSAALAHSALTGLGRIIAAEQPDIWSALIHVYSFEFPLQAIKYIPVERVRLSSKAATRSQAVTRRNTHHLRWLG